MPQAAKVNLSLRAVDRTHGAPNSSAIALCEGPFGMQPSLIRLPQRSARMRRSKMPAYAPGPLVRRQPGQPLKAQATLPSTRRQIADDSLSPGSFTSAGPGGQILVMPSQVLVLQAGHTTASGTPSNETTMLTGPRELEVRGACRAAFRNGAVLRDRARRWP